MGRGDIAPFDVALFSESPYFPTPLPIHCPQGGGRSPGGTAGLPSGTGSICRAFLSNVHAFLASYGDCGGAPQAALQASPNGMASMPVGGTSASPQQGPDDASLLMPATTYFSLMASAGGSLGRLEPWLQAGSEGGRVGPLSVAPPQASWRPPWTPPSDSSYPALRQGLGCDAGGMGSENVATAAMDPGSPVSLLHASSALLAPSAVASPGAASLGSSMIDVDDATPAQSTPAKGGGAAGAGDDALPEAGVEAAATSSASPGSLEAWHSSVVVDMRSWQERLKLGLSAAGGAAAHMGRCARWGQACHTLFDSTPPGLSTSTTQGELNPTDPPMLFSFSGSATTLRRFVLPSSPVPSWPGQASTPRLPHGSGTTAARLRSSSTR